MVVRDHPGGLTSKRLNTKCSREKDEKEPNKKCRVDPSPDVGRIT